MNSGQRLSSIVDDFSRAQRTQEDIRIKLDDMRDACANIASQDDDESRRVGPFCYVAVSELGSRAFEFESIVGVHSDAEMRNIGERILDIAATFDDEWSDREVISSLSTRVGSVLMIIFLVQIMAGIFRYSARMAAYYDSRYHILSVGRITRNDVRNLLEDAAVDFDKFPKHPISDIRDIVKKAVEAALKSKA